MMNNCKEGVMLEHKMGGMHYIIKSGPHYSSIHKENYWKILMVENSMKVMYLFIKNLEEKFYILTPEESMRVLLSV